MKQAGVHTRWKLYAAAFAAPVLLLAAVCAAAGFAPFGDKTLLTVDMNGQYVAFFSQLRSILLGKDDLLYTFGKALGGDMIGLFAYYIAQPAEPAGGVFSRARAAMVRAVADSF